MSWSLVHLRFQLPTEYLRCLTLFGMRIPPVSSLHELFWF